MKKEKKVVLFVDDSLLILERMIPILEESEHIQFVVHAGSYKEAVELLAQMQPDLALLDIQLPDKSGIELLKTIKEKYSEVTVGMITNHSTDHYKDVCRNLGASFFFDKSSEFDLIPQAISAA